MISAIRSEGICGFALRLRSTKKFAKAAFLQFLIAALAIWRYGL